MEFGSYWFNPNFICFNTLVHLKMSSEVCGFFIGQELTYLPRLWKAIKCSFKYFSSVVEREPVYLKIVLLFITYVVGTLKSRPKEKILLSTQNKFMLNLENKVFLQFYAQIFCLSLSMHVYCILTRPRVFKIL